MIALAVDEAQCVKTWKVNYKMSYYDKLTLEVIAFMWRFTDQRFVNYPS